jgi:hypothetical protein
MDDSRTTFDMESLSQWGLQQFQSQSLAESLVLLLQALVQARQLQQHSWPSARTCLARCVRDA